MSWNWKEELEIRFSILRELTWEDKVTDADIINEILNNEQTLLAIRTAIISSAKKGCLYILVRHWKIHRPLSFPTNFDVADIISSLRQESTSLERRIHWN